MLNYKIIVMAVAPFLISFLVSANEGPENWGVGIGMRNAQIPFHTSEKNVADVIPLFYYKDGRFSIDGLTATYNFANISNKSSLRLKTKFRFFDIPKEFQNAIRGNAFDAGFEYLYEFENEILFFADLLFDSSVRPYSTVRAEKEFIFGPFYATPSAYGQFRTKSFNRKYYGLDEDDPGIGFSIGAKVDMKLRVLENLYLLGNIDYEKYDKKTSRASTMNKNHQLETFLGFGFMKDNHIDGKPSGRENLKTKDYIRLSVAQATPSNLNEIFTLHTRKDAYENRLMGLAYGLAVSDTLFGADIQMFLQPMFIQHLSSEVQKSSQEYTLSVKGYYDFRWPILWRIGAAEGLSFVDTVTYVEQKEMNEKMYRESSMMNFLEFSLDFNLGSIFSSKGMESSWIGALIHHRSSIFESSSMFGRIKGGSNYIGAYYLHDF